MNKALNKEIMMNKETSVSEEDKTSMDRLGITNSSKQIYYYKQHRYEKLADAVRYAERDNFSAQNQELLALLATSTLPS